MFESFEEHDFDASVHDRDRFSCGVPKLDEYIKQLAAQHRKKNIAAVRVLVKRSEPSVIVGYYTLSAASVEGPQLGNVKGLPRHAVPCFFAWAPCGGFTISWGGSRGSAVGQGDPALLKSKGYSRCALDFGGCKRRYRCALLQTFWL